jgi:hypothetical protein
MVRTVGRARLLTCAALISVVSYRPRSKGSIRNLGDNIACERVLVKSTKRAADRWVRIGEKDADDRF